MPETNPIASGSELARQDQLAKLIELAKQQPGLAALMEVYQQEWYRLGTTIARPVPRSIKSVRVSTDSTPSFL